MDENEKIVKKAYNNKGVRGFNKGNPGKPKGTKNKTPVSLYNDSIKVYQALGGWNGLKKWAAKSNYNLEKFYGWIMRMLPTNIAVDLQADIKTDNKMTVEVVHTEKEKEKGEPSVNT